MVGNILLIAQQRWYFQFDWVETVEKRYSVKNCEYCNTPKRVISFKKEVIILPLLSSAVCQRQLLKKCLNLNQLHSAVVLHCNNLMSQVELPTSTTARVNFSFIVHLILINVQNLNVFVSGLNQDQGHGPLWPPSCAHPPPHPHHSPLQYTRHTRFNMNPIPCHLILSKH